MLTCPILDHLNQTPAEVWNNLKIDVLYLYQWAILEEESICNQYLDKNFNFDAFYFYRILK